MLTKALYPGSFDPITSGHVAMIDRALRIADELVVVVANAKSKQYLFTLAERQAMVAAAIAGWDRVSVVPCEGLLVDCAQEQNASLIVRGVRSGSDCDYECQMAAVNRQLAPKIETVLLPAEPELASLSSTFVRELLHHGADVAAFVPAAIQPWLDEVNGGA